MLNKIVCVELFSKLEAINSALTKYAMDLNILDSKQMWNKIRSYTTRKVNADQ